MKAERCEIILIVDKYFKIINNQYRRGGSVVEDTPRMREIGVRSTKVIHLQSLGHLVWYLLTKIYIVYFVFLCHVDCEKH